MQLYWLSYLCDSSIDQRQKLLEWHVRWSPAQTATDKGVIGVAHEHVLPSNT
jgi:hypothetical protein